MNHNSVIVCFVYLDVGMDTPDKNLIALFLLYLYQLKAKGGTIKIVKREITCPPEGGTVETVKEEITHLADGGTACSSLLSV